jgi:hypothetical protein
LQENYRKKNFSNNPEIISNALYKVPNTDYNGGTSREHTRRRTMVEKRMIGWRVCSKAFIGAYWNPGSPGLDLAGSVERVMAYHGLAYIACDADGKVLGKFVTVVEAQKAVERHLGVELNTEGELWMYLSTRIL